MSHPMDGCWAKIERAKENIKNLTIEADGFLRANADGYGVVGKLKNEREYVITAFDKGLQPVPLRFSVMAGEILHNLRTSLDHLVCAHVEARGGKPTRAHYFPICVGADQFKAAFSGKAVEGVAGRFRAIVESVQPYRKPKPVIEPLTILHELNNTDKHRLLIIAYNVLTLTSGGELGIGSDMGELVITGFSKPEWVRPTKDGAEVFCITFSKSQPDVKVEAQLSAQIAFEEFGPLKHEPVIPSLTHLAEATVKALELFRGEF
jgi:hypothetical protein